MKKVIALILFSALILSCDQRPRPEPPATNKEPVILNGKCFLRLTTIVKNPQRGTKSVDVDVLFQADQFRIFNKCTERTEFKKWHCVHSINGRAEEVPVKESVDQVAEQMKQCGLRSPKKGGKDPYFGD